MKIVEFSTTINLTIENQDITIKPKSLYLFSDIIQSSFVDQTKKVIQKKFNTEDDSIVTAHLNKIIKYEKRLETVLKPFSIKDKYNERLTKLIILRTGGIGDLISLSSLAYYLPDLANIRYENVYFVSQNKYREVFNWYKRKLNFVSYFSPVVSYKKEGFLGKKKIFNSLKPIFFEGVIENTNVNWYLLQYGQAKCDKFNIEWGRPQLRTDRVHSEKSRIDKSKPSILINPRSTAIIRSMRFQDIYEALLEIIGNKDCRIYVHKRNLRLEDVNYIKSQILKDNRIRVIDAPHLKGFFLDSWDADISISVDTALIHFREGIQKPAIGIYGPFTTDVRTKFYKYTHNFDITSSCPHMPCFIHVKHWNECCPFQSNLEAKGEYDNRWHSYAPCTCMEWNNTVKEQLINNMSDYVKNVLNI